MISPSAMFFELMKLGLTYLIIKIVFEVIQIVEDIVLVISKAIRGRVHSVCYLVYPKAAFVVREHETCPVCLCTRTDSVLQCGHAYHWGCVEGWLNVKNTCPVCRKFQRRWVEHRVE